MKRSLGAFTRGMREQAVDLRRGVLERVLNGVIVKCNDDDDGDGRRGGGGEAAQLYFYYQGLHDVAAVLTLVCGERAAYGMLKRLVVYNLRDCTMCVPRAPRTGPRACPRTPPLTRAIRIPARAGRRWSPSSSSCSSSRICCRSSVRGHWRPGEAMGSARSGH